MILPLSLENETSDDQRNAIAFRAIANNGQGTEPQEDPILCPHCRRTASNGIKCKGICVADSDY